MIYATAVMLLMAVCAGGIVGLIGRLLSGRNEARAVAPIAAPAGASRSEAML